MFYEIEALCLALLGFYGHDLWMSTGEETPFGSYARRLRNLLGNAAASN
jgi:hypothetical protein